MPDTFTPEQISQILEEFFKVVGTRQYIGARYVPIFGRKGEDSIEWDNTAPYEPLTIVLYQGNSYTSRQFVPVGVEITNQEFWAITGNYNAQVESYRRETARVAEGLAQTNQNLDQTNQNLDQTTQNLAQTNQNLAQTNQNLDQTTKNLAQTNQNLAQTNQNLAQTDQRITTTLQNSYFIDAFEGSTREDKLFNALDTIEFGILYVGQLTITKQYNAIAKDYRNIIISNGTLTFTVNEWFNQEKSTYNSVPTFANCVINGNNNTLFNGNYNCIGAKFDNCKLENIRCFNSTSNYIQSFALNNCVLNPVANLITATTIYDMHIIGSKIESSAGTLIKSTGQAGFVGCSIEGSLIEGRSDIVIECDAITQLSITGNYFESNAHGLLKQLAANYACNVYVSDNVFLGTMEDATYMFDFASSSRNIAPTFINNIFSIANKYISNTTRTTNSMLQANSGISFNATYPDSCFAPNINNKFIKQYIGYKNGIFDSADDTWHFSISIPYGEAYNVMNPFVVIFSGSSSTVTPIRQGGLMALCIPYITGDAKIMVKTIILGSQNQITASEQSTATIDVTADNNSFNSSNVTFDIKIGGFVSTRGRFFVMDFENMVNTYLG